MTSNYLVNYSAEILVHGSLVDCPVGCFDGCSDGCQTGTVVTTDTAKLTAVIGGLLVGVTDVCLLG